MIEAKDLKHGNYLKSHLTGGYVTTNWLVIKHVWDGNFQSVFNPDVPVYEPILLTPEILEKVGLSINGFYEFEWDIPMHKGQYRKLTLDLRGGFLYLREGSTNNRLEDDIVCLWNRDLKKEYYLHQLQNLYYSLTGEELEVEL
jgi:hypothetical protein